MGDTQAASASEPQRLECDIVMAGGVTSGIIYPGAVEAISRRYTFRSIGGASVGAIAAAATAAAEYGRLTGRNPDAFKHFAALPKSLGHVGAGGRTRLFHLFTADRATAALYELLTPAFAGGTGPLKATRFVAAGLGNWIVSTAVAVVALPGLAAVAFLGAINLPLAVFALLMTGATATVAFCGSLALLFRWRLLPAWRANGYGVCKGMAAPRAQPGVDVEAFESLSPWMHGVFQSLAGRTGQDPLTFGDLWSAAPQDSGSGPIDPASPRIIELAMISSDLTRNRTLQLPFLESPSPLYIKRKTLEEHFPADVVEWMVTHAGAAVANVAIEPDDVRLPPAGRLPVTFAARLSLSFPVLLSAIPLRTPDFAKAVRGQDAPLRTVWMSDGGLTSNFPIHFFDSPIPSRPTFCLNLVSFEAETTTEDDGGDFADGEDEARPPSDTRASAQVADKEALEREAAKSIATPQSERRLAAARKELAVSENDPAPKDEVWQMVSMSRGNRFIPAVFTAFDTAKGVGIGSFFSALLNTARFWSDNQLLIAPGMRDRVVNIALREDEGGLNLNMAPEVIADLDYRGRAAGLLISARFDPEGRKDPETGEPNRSFFAGHRWVRYRNFMAAFEGMSRRFATSRRASDEAATIRGEPKLDQLIDMRDVGYPALAKARGYFRDVTLALDELALDMAQRTSDQPDETFARPAPSGARRPAGGAPRPPMQIRLRPLPDGDPRAESADLPTQS